MGDKAAAADALQLLPPLLREDIYGPRPTAEEEAAHRALIAEAARTASDLLLLHAGCAVRLNPKTLSPKLSSLAARATSLLPVACPLPRPRAPCPPPLSASSPPAQLLSGLQQCVASLPSLPCCVPIRPYVHQCVHQCGHQCVHLFIHDCVTHAPQPHRVLARRRPPPPPPFLALVVALG